MKQTKSIICSILFTLLLLVTIAPNFNINPPDNLERINEKTNESQHLFQGNEKTATFGLTEQNSRINNIEKSSTRVEKRADKTIPVLKSREFQGGTGTKPAPYLISSIAQLQELRDSPQFFSGHFKLVNQLTFTNDQYNNTVKKWKPIGNESHPFTGSFDGAGFTIANLAIERTNEDNIGLFGKVLGELKNFRLENFTVSGQNNVGSLVGFLENGSVVDSSAGINKGVALRSSKTNAGGLIGYAHKSTVSNVHVNVSVILEGSDSLNVGGVIGTTNNSVINFSSANSFINITTAYAVGGLIGFIGNKSITLNSFATTYIETASARRIGGLIGEIYIPQTSDINIIRSLASQINGSYAESYINSTSAYIAGLIGFASYANISNCYAIIENERPNNPFGGFGGISGFRGEFIVRNSYSVQTVHFDIDNNPLYGGTAGGPISFEGHTEINTYAIPTNASNGLFNPRAWNPTTTRLVENFLNDLTLFADWDTVNIWKVAIGEFPSLRKLKSFNSDLTLSSAGNFCNDPVVNFCYYPDDPKAEFLWDITGSGNLGNATLFQDRIKIADVPWNGFSPFRVSLNELSVANYNFTLVATGINSSVINFRVDTVFVSVIDLPSLTEPSDITYTFGEKGNQVIWESGGTENSGNATLYRNGTEFNSLEWEATSALSFSSDGLSVGIHNFTLQLLDKLNSTVSDTVLVTVFSADFTISGSKSVIYDIATDVKTLTWNLTALGTSGTAFLHLNDLLFSSATSWVSSSELVFDISSLPVGVFNFQVMVTDFLGITLSNTVQVNITSFPNFTTNELVYQFGTVGNFLNWSMSGTQILGDLQLFRNGSEIFSDNWFGSQSFSQNIDGLNPGVHEFQLFITDNFNTQTSYTVLVRVQTTFSISSPDDFTFLFGTTGNMLSWTRTGGAGKTGTATLFLDDVPFGEAQEWSSSSPLNFSLDGLPVGTHNFKLEFIDSTGKKIQDSVIVIVIASSTSSENSLTSSSTSTNTSSSTPTSASEFSIDLQTIFIIGGIILISAIGVFTFYLILRKSKVKSKTVKK